MKPSLNVEHNEQGSVSVSQQRHGRLDVMKQTQNGDVEIVFTVDLGPHDKMHIIAHDITEPQEASQT